MQVIILLMVISWLFTVEHYVLREVANSFFKLQEFSRGPGDRGFIQVGSGNC